ncbi:MAG TPA: agglutinin biogenesis protein MshI [Burkholderiaceae bacterium]|jgi:MSHA biogenesis protein MshI|nr:agglutinin biogenesis protein MshI [Burkholderiaceae bacterium]
MGLFTKDKRTAGWMSIVLHDDGARAAHILRGPNAKPSVEWIASYPLNKSGDEMPLEKMAKELRANRYACTTLLASSEYQLLSVEAPTVPQEELKTAIRWRLKDMLDFRVDDATIDVLDVPFDKDAPARTHSMYVAAARNQVIEQRQTLFNDAKIPLKVIDIPDLAQRNISVLLESDGRGVALLSFDASGGLLTVTYAGELYLSRRIDVTLTQITKASGEEKIALFEKITLELQRSLDHFDRQYHFISVAALQLAPLGGVHTGLADYLASNLYLPVESFNFETILDLAKVPELKATDLQQRYFFALGAALRLEEKVL